MAFNPNAFDPTAFTIATPATQVFTSHKDYWTPLRCRVEIYDNKGLELLLVYDAFFPNSTTIKLLDCEVTLGLTNSSFTLKFEDGQGTINQSTIGLGNKVLIYAGRVANNLTLIFTGYSIKRSPRILGNHVMEYSMEGHSEMASFNDIIVNFKRASSELVDITDPNFPKRPDSLMSVHELVRDLMEDLDVRVTKDIRIKEYLNLDISGISAEVKERLLSVAQQLTEVSQVLNFFSEVTGAYWKIENGKLFFEYPDVRHSGIIIKNKTDPSDLATTTSYFNGSWSYTDSISKEDGFANRIYINTNIDTKSVANSMVNQGSTSLYGRAIATQFTTVDSRIQTLALILSRVGDPFSDIQTEFSTDVNEQVIEGEIRIDNNNSPDGAVISQFEVQAGGLTSTPDTIFVNDIKIDASVLSPNAKYWIVLMPTGTSNRDTIRWHHDGDLSTANHWSAFAQGQSKSDLGDWQKSRFGPTFCHAVFARIRRLQEYSDPQSIAKFRLKEDVHDAEFLDDSLSVAKLAQNVLAVRGKPVRLYEFNEVTLPLNTWFVPGLNVTIVDDTGHHEIDRNIFAEIQEVRYSWSTEAANKTIGTFSIGILPVGHLNWHTELFPSGD